MFHEVNCPLLPFFFPTTVLHIDDHASYVRLLASLFGYDLYVEGYVSAREALTKIHKAYQRPRATAELMYRHMGRGTLSPEEVVALDVAGVHRIVYEPERFSEISVVVVDYYMPEMNGLEFCRRLPHRNIGRILLTGRADRSVAVRAFNEGVIDRFIEKSSEGLMQEVQLAVAELQAQHFQRGSALVAETLALGGFSFLQDATVISVIKQQFLSITPAEMYVHGSPSGLLFLDGWGIAEFILVVPEETLFEQAMQAEEAGAPEWFVAALRSGQYLAWLPDSRGYYDVNQPISENVLMPAVFVQGSKTAYYIAKARNLDWFKTPLITGYYTWLRERDAERVALASIT